MRMQAVRECRRCGVRWEENAPGCVFLEDPMPASTTAGIGAAAACKEIEHRRRWPLAGMVQRAAAAAGSGVIP